MKSKRKSTPIGVAVLPQAFSFFCDTHGQKHSRLTSLGALVILLVFSCSDVAFLVHRARRRLSQLTAATRLPKRSVIGWRF